MAAHSYGALLILIIISGGKAASSASVFDSDWRDAYATFYGDFNGDGSYGGACAYSEEETKDTYGTNTAALSFQLFQNGESCGNCYTIKCVNSTWCKSSEPITITATNSCPPDPSKPSDNGGWCNPPRQHFDMSMPAWLTIGSYRGGIIPVKYKRVPCRPKKGGVRFTITGDNENYNFVVISNVGGAGSLLSVDVKGSGEWMKMTRNWGQEWQTKDGKLPANTALSFRITTTDGENLEFTNAVPYDWKASSTKTFPTLIQF